MLIFYEVLCNQTFWKWTGFYGVSFLGFQSLVNNLYLPHASSRTRISATSNLFSLTHATISSLSGLYFGKQYSHLITASSIGKNLSEAIPSSALAYVDGSISYFICDLLYTFKYEPTNMIQYIHHFIILLYTFALRRSGCWFNMWSISFGVGEASTIILQLFRFLKYSKNSKILKYNKFLQLIYFIMFLYARLFASHKLNYYFFKNEMEPNETKQTEINNGVRYIFYLSSIMILVLSNVWNVLIIKKLLKYLKKSGLFGIFYNNK
eukprot:88240_1